MDEKMRAEFESWAVHHGYDLTRDDVVVAYASEETDRVWAAWQASRAALVVDIPKAPSKKLVGGDFLCGWASCVEEISEAIESTGVRVKP